jgi:hypothetical protein
VRSVQAAAFYSLVQWQWLTIDVWTEHRFDLSCSFSGVVERPVMDKVPQLLEAALLDLVRGRSRGPGRMAADFKE